MPGREWEAERVRVLRLVARARPPSFDPGSVGCTQRNSRKLFKGRKQGEALEKPNNDPLTASCLVLQKGKGQGLYDLLADESFEKGIKECFTQGKY